MAKHANIQLFFVERPAGSRAPRMAISPADHFGTSPEEHDRVAREASQASVLMTKSTAVQQKLAERLARNASGGRLKFRFVAALERFLQATHSLDEGAAAALSDAELAALWQVSQRPS